MIKIILMDCDGPVIHRDKYFSERLQEERGMVLNKEAVRKFFRNGFLDCERGEKDLKEELLKCIAEWGWKGSVEELMDYWFSGERQTDDKMLGEIQKLRKRGIKCYLSTNNEKYRAADVWENAGLKNHFDGMFASSGLGYLKSESGFWARAYESMAGIPKSEVLVWDDEDDVIRPAKEFGFEVELFTTFDNFAGKIHEGSRS